MQADKLNPYLSDQVIDDIMDIAGGGGITYWAIEPNATERAGCPEDHQYVVVEGTGDDIFGFDEREVEEVHYLTRDQIRAAYGRLLQLDQELVGRELHDYILQSWVDRDEDEGIDVGHIDAGAADAIVQVACFGELIYG